MKRYVRPSCVLQLLEQVDDLRLDRDVEGGHRLVGDDQLGLERERPGDADALALAAGELVRVPASAVRGRPTSSSSSRTSRRGPAPRRTRRAPAAARRRSTPTVCRGLRLASGSWKTICIRRRIRRSARGERSRSPRRRR